MPARKRGTNKTHRFAIFINWGRGEFFLRGTAETLEEAQAYSAQYVATYHADVKGVHVYERVASATVPLPSLDWKAQVMNKK